MVGRHRARAALADALAAATDGSPRLVLVAGPAGMGKTSLVESFQQGLAPDVVVLGGACTAVADVGFTPLFAACRRLAARLGPERAAAVLASAPALAAAVGMAGPGVGERRVSDHQAVFADVLHVLGTAGSGRPVVLVLEDLHWADADTVSLLGFLARTLTHEPALVIGTYRSDEIDRGHRLRPLLRELARADRATLLELDPLGRAELEELAVRRGHHLDPATLDELVRRSEGNPFFAEELLEAGVDAGLPPAVEDLLLGQIEVLPAEVGEVLRVASVAGRAVPPELLVALVDEDGPVLDDALRAAVAARFLDVDDEGRLRFRHALLAEAASSTLLPPERRRLHRRLAEALESGAVPGLVPSRAELAHHWREAGDPERALRSALAAADESLGRHAPASLHDLLTLALDLWGRVADPGAVTGTDRTELLLRAAEAASAAGRHRDAVRCADEAAAAVGDPRPRAAAEVRRLRALFAAGRIDDARDAARRAREVALGWSDPLARATVLVEWAALVGQTGGYHEVLEVEDELVALVEQVGDPDLRVLLEQGLGTARAGTGDTAVGLARLRAAVDLALANGDTDLAGPSIYTVFEIALLLDEPAAAVREAAQGLERARAVGAPRPAVAAFESCLADLLFRSGRWREVDELLARRTAPPHWLAALRWDTVRGLIALERGDLELARWCADSAEVRAGHQTRVGGTRVAILETKLALARRDHDAALARVETALARADQGSLGLYGCQVASLGARSATLLGRIDDAERHAGLATAIVEQLLGLGGRPAVHLGWAALARAWAAQARAAVGGDPAATVAAWEEAADRLGAAGVRVEEAWARRHLAAALLAAGDREGGAAQLERARPVAEEVGAIWLVAQVDDLRRRARLADSPGQRDAVNAFGLTDREREVLGLLAEGLTNGEIGERLFISAKTASVHVTNLLRKLGVANRRDAARRGRELGLVGPV